MSATSVPPAGEHASRGQHLATITHDGRFWDAYLELEEVTLPESHRGRLAFSPIDQGPEEAVLRTSTVIIEPSREAALRSADRLDTYHLVALLRSLLP